MRTSHLCRYRFSEQRKTHIRQSERSTRIWLRPCHRTGDSCHLRSISQTVPEGFEQEIDINQGHLISILLKICWGQVDSATTDLLTVTPKLHFFLCSHIINENHFDADGGERVAIVAEHTLWTHTLYFIY